MATFYLIQAGRDAAKKLEFKKKLLETANNKNFDLAKLQRLLSFVKLLVQLPKPFESVYQDYSNDSKNNKKAEKMGASRAF
ncbi:MAG: hypothetical protein U5L45_14645 [Saprospiraceae bacterium]|nr:hypothetical protein [Saprospiraceae bacterium]